MTDAVMPANQLPVCRSCVHFRDRLQPCCARRGDGPRSPVTGYAPEKLVTCDTERKAPGRWLHPDRCGPDGVHYIKRDPAWPPR